MLLSAARRGRATRTLRVRVSSSGGPGQELWPLSKSGISRPKMTSGREARAWHATARTCTSWSRSCAMRSPRPAATPRGAAGPEGEVRISRATINGKPVRTPHFTLDDSARPAQTLVRIGQASGPASGSRQPWDHWPVRTGERGDPHRRVLCRDQGDRDGPPPRAKRAIWWDRPAARPGHQHRLAQQRHYQHLGHHQQQAPTAGLLTDC